MIKPVVKKDEFLNVVGQWIAEQQEVLLLIYSRFGTWNFEFHQNINSFIERVDEMDEINQCIHLIALKDYDFKLRGIVNEVSIEKALAYIVENEEYMIISDTISVVPNYKYFDNSSGRGHHELNEDLKDYLGQKIALGKYPIWDEEHITQIECIFDIIIQSKMLSDKTQWSAETQ